MAAFNMLGLMLLAASCLMVSSQERPVVDIPGQGMVRGIRERSTVKNEPFYSFRGVPFAKPPSGALRFKAPEPADPWEGIKEATIWGEVCHQSGPLFTEKKKLNYWDRLHAYFGDNSTQKQRGELEYLEDCLYINVYTRSLEPDAKLPVVVYYHGGSFTTGGSYIYFPDFFMDHEMVLVVPHYRLGPLGFLSMQNDEIPGNAGMLDQVFALEWVRDYIHVFGGDRDEITAMGESAGAASVSLLALSPLTQGLIKRVIAQSGAALAEWAVDREPLFNTRGVAEKLGCDMTSNETITACFMNTEDPGYINNAQDDWSDEQRKLGKNGFGATTPVVQTTGKRIFLDKFPEDIWADSNYVGVPGLYGANKHEGTYVLGIVYDDYIRANDLLEDEEFMKYGISKPFLTMFGIEDSAYTVTDAVEHEYIGIERMGNFTAMTPGLIDFSGSVFLKAPGYQSVAKHAKFGESYWYVYNYHGFVTTPLCAGIVGTDYPWPPGVCHAAEIPMLFGVPGVYTAMLPKEKKIARQMTKMWYNFAKYGNPTPEESPIEDDIKWPAFDLENMYYLQIDRNITVQSDFTLEYTVAKDQDFSLSNN